ncbi:MAG: uroporphyrinogen decarboxylase family protein [Candidatus Latescibacterota bacterium]
MTARERLFAALDGEPTDHVPVWLLFPYHPLDGYVDVRSHPRYQALHRLSLSRCITLDRRQLGVPLHAPTVASWREDVVQHGARMVCHHLELGDQRLTACTVPADPTRNRKLVSSAEDLDIFCSLPLETDPERIRRALDRQLPHYLLEREGFPAHLGATMLDLGEPIAPLYHAARPEEYALWSVTHQDLVLSWLRRSLERCFHIYRYCLTRNLADVYLLPGSELASPPLVSRATFQRWVVPFAAELIHLVHQHGKRVIQHHHGAIRALLPDFLDMGADALHTVEAPPTGDCTLGQAAEVVGDRLVLIGNVQDDALRSLSAEEMAGHVRAILDECRGRRVILSPTAGPYDPDPPEALIRNLRVLVDAAWDYA